MISYDDTGVTSFVPNLNKKSQNFVKILSINSISYFSMYDNINAMVSSFFRKVLSIKIASSACFSGATSLSLSILSLVIKFWNTSS